MSFTYAVPKRKSSRISYRIIGIIFIIVAILQFIPLLNGYSKHPLLTAIFTILILAYGINLVRMSLRKQAFDITYRWDNDGFTVTHHYGEKHYTYDDIEFITMVIADENMLFYVLNLKAAKDIYTIPFTMKGELCEKIYEFVNPRIKHNDD